MQDINPQNLRYAKLVDRYARYVKSPILRLKFLQSAMKIDPPEGFVTRLPVVGSLQHRALLIVELSKVLPVTEAAPLALRITALLYRLRHAVYAACLLIALAARGADDGERLTRPLGIVYHVSEGDQLPFDNEYNASLQTHSKALLEYARGHRLYNYIIDRFGRVYRIVRDEETANHAGNSAWSDGRNLYVNLNASFIGVCFEGQSRRGKAVGADGINEAQIYAARQLTAVLRSKYQIADANCVTHGLVSVNPSNKLMGYHTDWVAGFPFAAIGLTNKYEAEIAAISRLGVDYDSTYLAAAGANRLP